MDSSDIKDFGGDAPQLAEIFKTLGDPLRIRIISLLAEDSGYTVGEMAKKLEVSQSGLSHQMQYLRRSKVVLRKKSGKSVFYSLKNKQIIALIKQAMEITTTNGGSHHEKDL